ncbi:MAG: glycine zipper 2TM domain-containing protein [Luteimonas sp.]
MKRLTASILALGLATTVGAASAQSNGYYSQSGQPTPDRYGQNTYNPGSAQNNGSYYEYARVIRVDRVAGSGYASSPASNGSYSNGSQRCYPQNQNNGYVTNDGYSRNGYSRNGSSRDGYSGDGYNRDGYSSNDGYRDDGYNDSDRNNGGSQTARTVATVVGGIAGAVLGSKVGGGSGSYAASAIGSMVGGMAGRSVYDNTQRQRTRQGIVTVCDPVPANGAYYPSNNTYNAGNGANAYDVTYEYGGRRYTTRTNYHPGERIRVRVDVRPE